MATANPAMNEAVYMRAGRADLANNVMTLQGCMLKTGILVALLLVAGAFTFTQFQAGLQGAAGAIELAYGLGVAGAIGGLITALITIFVPKASPFTAPVYAACEGLLLGMISGIFEKQYQGIASEAILLSVGVLVIMLVLYGTRIVQATEKFKIGIIAATGAICLVYLVSMVMGFFGARIPYIHDSGPIGIGFSLVVVVIASLNLILDFDFIEQGVRRQAPKYMEWYGGFSLLVTLVWMYMEILRLLAKLKDNRG
ncbi:MAG TPA: Bax inhibitor-1/YccA family protein [Gemmataceae bacterium]|nr:Bax inhibitor-1/YccA family protein [Gemmataceae bacterium]